MTDITEALILTSAAQSLRRKMRIKKVLAPRLPALSTAGTEVTSDTSSLADLDGDPLSRFQLVTGHGDDTQQQEPVEQALQLR